MKKILISVIIGFIIGVGALYVYLNPGIIPGFGEKGKTSSTQSEGKNSFYQVTKNLNKGSDLYLYASTEKILAACDKLALKLKKLVADKAPIPENDKAMALKVFDLVYGLINKTGLTDISGFGLSSGPIAAKLNNTKFVMHHYQDKGNGLIWNLMDQKPHALDSLKLLPADTVMANFSDFKLSYLWNWLKTEALASGIPDLAKGFESVEPMLKQQGIELEQLLGSLGQEWGMFITLDEKNESIIPIQGMEMKIPQPGMAIVFTTKNDYIFNLLAEKMTFAKAEEDKGMQKLLIPVPKTPFPLEPMIVKKGNLLIVASNGKVLDDLVAAQSGSNGLVATEEFKRLSMNMPAEGNSFRYVSTRLFGFFLKMQQMGMEAAAKYGKTDPFAKEIMALFPKEFAFYGVVQNTKEGLIGSFNHTFGLEFAALIPATAAVGVIAAIAIPNFIQASGKGKQKKTLADIRNIGFAIDAYILDNKSAPVGESLADIRALLVPKYLAKMPMLDGWGNELLYSCKEGTTNYFIASPGSDNNFLGWTQTGKYYVSGKKDMDKDIIFSNGAFVFSPELR